MSECGCAGRGCTGACEDAPGVLLAIDFIESVVISLGNSSPFDKFFDADEMEGLRKSLIAAVVALRRSIE